MFNHPRGTDSEQYVHLQYLMMLRVILVTLFLCASLFIETRSAKTLYGSVQTFHYLLISFLYALTILYAFLLQFYKDVKKLTYIQLIVDTILITAIIYSTGITDSLFSFLYLVVIIAAGILLYRVGALTIAACTSISYGLLLLLYYTGIINPLAGTPYVITHKNGLHLLYDFFINMAASFTVAFLSSYLSEQTKKARRELKAKESDFYNLEALHKSIINGVFSGIIATDERGAIVLFNPASEKILGIKAKDAMGRPVSDILPSMTLLNKPHLPAPSAHAFMDIQHIRPDGTERYMRISWSPLRLPDKKKTGQIFLFQDMTEIRRIELEMKRMEGLANIGELAARVAHEIRNPLASISGSVQMLRQGAQQNEIFQRLTDIVIREVKRLNHLVDDFLLFAKSRKNSPEPFELNEVILESINIFQCSPHMNKKINVDIRLNDNIFIVSDPDGIKQVLWNLFLNACDAMPHGGDLYVETSVHGEEACITVRDTGPGFDRDCMGMVFDPFFTTKERGTGLGLAIVKGIVNDLGGSISADNHENGGAVVKIILPLEQGDKTLCELAVH